MSEMFKTRINGTGPDGKEQTVLEEIRKIGATEALYRARDIAYAEADRLLSEAAASGGSSDSARYKASADTAYLIARQIGKLLEEAGR